MREADGTTLRSGARPCLARPAGVRTPRNSGESLSLSPYCGLLADVRDRVDFDLGVWKRQSRHDDRGTGRLALGEELGVYLVHGLEIGGIGQIHAAADHLGQR